MTRRVPCTGLRGSALTGLVSALMLVGGTAIAAPGDPGLGTEGTSVAVDALERTEDGLLRVTATVTNHGQDTFPSSRLREFSMPNSTLGLAVVDPATGAVSRPDDEQGLLPVFIEPGQSVSVVVPVQDPGGDVVDVVFTAFHPVTRLAVAGEAVQGDVSTLEARSITPLPRVEQGAAEVTGTDKVTLDTNVLFAFDSAELSPEASDSLDTAAASLGEQDGRRLGVYGHTDSQGDEAYNLQLSQGRAEAVSAALKQRLGSGWTFDVQGRGETEAVAPEVDEGGAPYPDGQARNRRVDITVLG